MIRLFLTLLSLLLPASALAETRTYFDPSMGRFRLDYCRYDRAECGFAAARAFCEREGYTMADTFTGERDVGRTMRVGDRGTCISGECDGFSEITCSREGPLRVINPGANPIEPLDRPDTNPDD